MDLLFDAVKSSLSEKPFDSFEQKRKSRNEKTFTRKALLEIIEELKDKSESRFKKELIEYLERIPYFDESNIKVTVVTVVGQIMVKYTPDPASVLHLIREARTLLDILIYDSYCFECVMRDFPLLQANKEKEWKDFIADDSKEFYEELILLVQSDAFDVMVRASPLNFLLKPYKSREIALVFYSFGRYDLEEEELRDYLGYD